MGEEVEKGYDDKKRRMDCKIRKNRYGHTNE